jgi:hypothetical protein
LQPRQPLRPVGGKALLQLRHQEGWYYPDGEVASRSEWPQ